MSQCYDSYKQADTSYREDGQRNLDKEVISHDDFFRCVQIIFDVLALIIPLKTAIVYSVCIELAVA
jgi:hypothetical protein